MKIAKVLRELQYNINIMELRQKEDELDISYNSLLYLSTITYQKKCTVSSLAETLGVSKSAVTLKLNELEKKSLVSRTQSLEDKRINYIKPSKEAVDSFNKYNCLFDEPIASIKERYSSDKISIFCEILEHFNNQISIKK